MTQRLDLTLREHALVQHELEGLPEVHLVSGNGSGVFAVLQTPQGLWKRFQLRPYYDKAHERGGRRLQMFHLRDAGTHVAISYGGSYSLRQVVLFDLTPERVIVVRGRFGSVVEAMAGARRAVTA